MTTGKKVGKALVGNAGEHYVAFQLSGRGYAVGLTARGTEGIDLLAANNDTGKTVIVQVKTMTDARVNSPKWGLYWKWRIGKNLPHALCNFFLAFVDLRDGPSPTSPCPDVFIVPSADLLVPSADPGFPLVETYPKKGSPKYKGYPTEFWCDIYEKYEPKYKDNWELIEKALA